MLKIIIGLPRGGKVYHTHYRGSRLNYKPHSPRGTYKKRGRPKKKHLTGNAYYAAKAGKEMKKKNLSTTKAWVLRGVDRGFIMSYKAHL